MFELTPGMAKFEFKSELADKNNFEQIFCDFCKFKYCIFSESGKQLIIWNIRKEKKKLFLQ